MSGSSAGHADAPRNPDDPCLMAGNAIHEQKSWQPCLAALLALQAASRTVTGVASIPVSNTV